MLKNKMLILETFHSAFKIFADMKTVQNINIYTSKLSH